MHPGYNNDKLERNNKERIKLFFLKNLNNEGIEVLDNIQSRSGIFHNLHVKELEKAITFWNMAKHPPNRDRIGGWWSSRRGGARRHDGVEAVVEFWLGFGGCRRCQCGAAGKRG